MKTTFFLLLLAVSFSAVAQRKHHKMDFTMPEITHGIGASFQKFDGLNSRIANLPQYKQLPNHSGTLQLGWIKERNQFISDFNLMAGSSMSGDRDKKSSVIRYYGANANIGYDVIKSKKILLYPSAGIGFQKYQARFFKDVSAVNFDDVLTSPNTQNAIRSVDFKNTFLIYRLGIGFAVKPPKCPFSSIGLQAGYTGSFKDKAWRSSEDQALQNAPVDKVSQFYVSLIMVSKPWMMMKH